MNADPAVFAEWLCRQGHRVVRTASSYWVAIGPRLYQAFPYHWLVHPSDAELLHLLRQNRGIGLRYSTSLDSPAAGSGQGMISYHVLCEVSDYSLSTLTKKARYDVRKGLARACVEPIPLARLAAEGWELRFETLQRQRRAVAENRAGWQRLCSSAQDLPGFEAWGAIVGKQLAASLLAFTCDGCSSILYQQSRTEYLGESVNHALAYVFTSQALKRPGTVRVFYGLHSLDAPSSVDEFKFRMGYVARPVRQRVFFHPWIQPFFNRASHAVLGQLVHWSQGLGHPRYPTLAKAEGMARFYLEGRRPLSEQRWPAALGDQAEGRKRSA